MKIYELLKSLFPSFVLICGAAALAQTDMSVPFPEHYRMWVHVKTTVIGLNSANFARNGGMHLFYANEKAVEGYRTGKFQDGSIVVDDLVEAKEVDGVTRGGPRKRIAVMAKDSARFPETGGWGFEVFVGEERSRGSLTAEGKAACFACHQKGRDAVFSEFEE